MNFEIRPAAIEDTEKIVQFNIEMALESENLRLEPEKVRLGVEKSLSNPSMGCFYLAHRGDEILGQIRVTQEWSDWNNAQYWWIQNVYVVPSARKTGHLQGFARSRQESRGSGGSLPPAAIRRRGKRGGPGGLQEAEHDAKQLSDFRANGGLAEKVENLS